VKREEGK